MSWFERLLCFFGLHQDWKYDGEWHDKCANCGKEI